MAPTDAVVTLVSLIIAAASPTASQSPASIASSSAVLRLSDRSDPLSDSAVAALGASAPSVGGTSAESNLESENSLSDSLGSDMDAMPAATPAAAATPKPIPAAADALIPSGPVGVGVGVGVAVVAVVALALALAPGTGRSIPPCCAVLRASRFACFWPCTRAFWATCRSCIVRKVSTNSSSRPLNWSIISFTLSISSGTTRRTNASTSSRISSRFAALLGLSLRLVLWDAVVPDTCDDPIVWDALVDVSSCSNLAAASTTPSQSPASTR
mmetsp:Transcript_21716/g.50120  ORF Transcript_21716/g.50120 Transcript_21716/m.50120 type:complete len:270 (-) Transcript_21716:286-1095(-)